MKNKILHYPRDKFKTVCGLLLEDFKVAKELLDVNCTTCCNVLKIKHKIIPKKGRKKKNIEEYDLKTAPNETLAHLKNPYKGWALCGRMVDNFTDDLDPNCCVSCKIVRRRQLLNEEIKKKRLDRQLRKEIGHEKENYL